MPRFIEHPYYGDKIKKDGMAVHVARMGEMRNIVFLSENVKKRDHLKDRGVHGRIILKWI
jgi:hypothetical protein